MSRKTWWIATLALCAFTLWGVLRLQFDTEPSSLFPKNIKEARGLGLFLKHFAHEGELIVMLDGAEKSDLLATSEVLEKKLKTMPELVSRVVAKSPWEDKPEEMVDFFAYSLLNLPESKLAALAETLTPETIGPTLKKSLESLETSLTMEENLAGYDPLGLAKLVMSERGKGLGSFDGFSSRDGRARILIVEAAHHTKDFHEKDKWLGEVRKVINAAVAESALPHVRARLTGEPAFVAEISTGMERDMKGSGLSTLVLSALLFFLIYRSLKPLLYINLAIGLVVLFTLGLSGWLMGTLTVFSAGFAGILVGLTIDYGVLIYEEGKNSGLGGHALRKHSARTILAAAGTTAAAFLSMRASSLPGVQELGVLLSMGIVLGAVVMLVWFPRWLGEKPSIQRGYLEWEGHPRVLKILPPVVLVLLLISLAGLVIKGMPGFNGSPDTLRPRECEAQSTMTDLLLAMSGESTGKSLLIHGATHEAVGKEIEEITQIIKTAEAQGVVHGMAMPGPVWPSAKNQAGNLGANGPASNLLASAGRLKKAVLDAGFSDEAFGLATGVFACWERWKALEKFPVWPETFASQWTLSRFHKVADDGVYALGVVQTKAVPEAEKLINTLRARESTYVLSDGVVIKALKEKLPEETLRITAALAVGMLLMLIWTFKHWWPIMLTLVSMLVNLLSLQGVMSLAGIEWNLINLVGLLLCLGTGVDYSIHVLLSLQRNGNNIPEMQRTTGRALLLCALSSVVGFGSLSWAGNKGLASLGVVCSIALFISLLISMFLLPYANLWRKR